MDPEQILTYLSIRSLAPPEATSIDECGQCGGIRRRDTANHVAVCPDCGSVEHIVTDDEPASSAYDHCSSHLRIIGPGGHLYQPGLNSICPGNSIEDRAADVFGTYQRLLSLRKGTALATAIPERTLAAAATTFSTARNTYRNNNRIEIMASILHKQCILDGQLISPGEIATAMGLKIKGTAKGDRQVRKLVVEGKIPASIIYDVDPVKAGVETLFGLLYDKPLADAEPEAADCPQDGQPDRPPRPSTLITADIVDKLRKATELLVKKANSCYIGVNSADRTQIGGAAYIILNRRDPKFTLDAFCAMTKKTGKEEYRKNTLSRYVGAFKNYSYIVTECCKLAGL